MNIHILVITSLLASTAAAGAALASGHFAKFEGQIVDWSTANVGGGADDRVRQVAGRDHERHRQSDGHHRRDHHDDEDDDDHDGDRDDRGRSVAVPPNGPSDPAAPVPNNGLFGGKARPQVEVK